MIENTSPPNQGPVYDPLAKLFDQYKRNSRLLISISIVGIVLFVLVAIAFPFRDRILERFFPKPKSHAGACSAISQIPSVRSGFVFTGGDLAQASSSLKTSLYYSPDFNLGPNRSVFIIGKYAQNQADPLGLRLLMGNNLGNIDFKGLRETVPAGWSISGDKEGTGSASIDTESRDTISKGTSVKLSNSKGAGTKILQEFKGPVSEGQFVIFGAWVKANKQEDVKVSVRNTQSPYQEFGVADSSIIEPGKWTYIVGYGKVPTGVKNFQLALNVLGTGNTVWFDGAEAAAVGPNQNQVVTDLVLARCGAAWMIDDGPGWEQSSSSPFMKPLSTDIYALIYYQFYTLIKNTDPSAKVMPGGLVGAPIVFDSQNGYSPKMFLDGFRASYKKFFNMEPPIDILGIRYLATDKNRWSGSADLENYLTKLRDYMDKVSDWKGVPIWISRLGVSVNAPNGGIDFINSSMKFLASNNLNIEKWFWYDTCGSNSQLAPLFIAKDKICSWPMKLSALGEAYLALNSAPVPTPTPAPSKVPAEATPSATVTPTIAPTPILSTPAPVSTSSGNLNEGTSSGGTTK